MRTREVHKRTAQINDLCEDNVGELDPKDLRDTTLDPEHRMLIRLATEDMERELDIFDILHGNDSGARKNLMKNFKITREELDN